MAERPSDIEFDFFEEPETQEAPARPRQPRAGGPRPPARPPTGLTPLLRLVGAVSFAIAIVVVLVFVVQRCQSEGKRDTYRNYMGDVSQIARDSERIGRDLNALLTTRGLKRPDLEQRLEGLAQQQQQGIARAQALTSPGPLREEQAHAVDALQFRRTGLLRLRDAFNQTASTRDADAAAALLADQARRLLASDVIWDDLFKEPSIDELQRQDLRGVEVPDSNFLQTPEFATTAVLKPIWQRIVQGASTGGGRGRGQAGGRHGNALLAVKVLPGGRQLDPSDNIVVASQDLAFEVTIENQGDSQEVQVPVRLTVQQSPRPIRKTIVIPLINAGEQKTVVFRDLGQIVQFAQKTTVKVQVEPVENEARTENNAASYPVTFSLTPP